jgi:hypothetical protein
MVGDVDDVPNLPQAYLSFYPDVATLADIHMDRAEIARRHYQNHGYKEMRVYKRPRVLLRYKTCGNTVQQHYSHVAGLTIATALGADVVVPPWAPAGPEVADNNDIKGLQLVQPFWDVWDAEHIST